MWTVDNQYLPTTATPGGSGLLTEVDTGATYGGGLLAIAQYNTGSTLTGQTPAIVTDVGTTAGNEVTIPTGQSSVEAVITSGGVAFTPAADISNPQPGEFVHNPYTGEVVLTTSTDFPVGIDEAVSLIGANADVSLLPLEPIPAIARFLFPTARNLSWQVGLEEHPSGTLELQANNATLPIIKQRLARGTEFSIYGIGFRCGSMRIASSASRDFPEGLHIVSISLEGKWENYVSESFPFRRVGQLTGDGTTDAELVDEDTPATYTLTDIAAYVGATYAGPEGIVQVPENARAGESTTLEAELGDRTRINGSIIDYTDGSAIRMKPLRGGRVWEYRGGILAEVDLVQEFRQRKTVQAFTEDPAILMPIPTAALPSSSPSFATPTLREEDGDGIVIEWENYQLTGDFANPATADEGEPTFAASNGRDRWVQRQRVRTIVSEGDEDAASPPSGATAIRDVSLNFDQSGPTKTLTLTTKEDGFITLVEQFRYGYAFTAADIESGGELNGSPAAWWQLIEFTRKERKIDRDGTGYAYGWDTTGFRLARFKQESSDNPETLSLAPGDPTLPLYEFQRVTIRETERDLLKQHRDFYDNLDTSDQQGELIKITLADGSESYRYLRNPNYAEPMFIAASSRESVAFISTENPEDATLPKLISGREEYSRTRRDLQPGQKRVFRAGAGNTEQPGDRTPDLYTDYTVQFTSQDGQYSNSLEDAQFKDFEGRPGEAERLPPEYVREEPPEDDGAADETDETLNKLRLLNSGTPTDAIGRQLNYPQARTLDEALLAARTDATLENLEQGTRETIEVPWNPDIRPGDRVVYEVNGEIRRRFVLGVSWQPQWVEPATGTVSLELARWVDAGAALTYTEIDLPDQDTAGAGDGSGEAGAFLFNRFKASFQLGELLQPTVVSRVKGNY